MNTWMPTAALTNKRNVPNSSNAPTPLRIRSKGTSMATACKKWIFLITITEAVTLSSLEKYARRRDPTKSSNIITYLHLYFHSKMPNNLNYFSPFFFTEFLVWMLSKIFSGKKIISTTQLNYSYLKKNSPPLHKTTTILLKTVRQKTRSQDCETNKFFFTYSVTDSYYGEKLSSVSVFFILKLLKTKQKTKIVSSKKWHSTFRFTTLLPPSKTDKR